MADTTFIYALCEPDTGEVRYVGKADNPKKRYAAHLNEKNKAPKGIWISELKSRNVFPRLEVLLDVSRTEWEFWEKEMISLFVGQLFNRTIGGNGLQNPSSATRFKIGAAHKNKIVSEETRAKQRDKKLGVQLSEAHKRNIGASGKGRKTSAETKKKLSDFRLGRKESAVQIEKNRAAQLLRWAKHRAEKLRNAA